MCCHRLRIQFVSPSCVVVVVVFFLLLLPPLLLPPRPSPSLALSLLPSHSASRRLLLSPHLMRPHNNTAVVQLFCYLSQTAGSLHSVFRAPFTCLLRQGNEYHLELQSTSPQKRVVRHLRLHLRRTRQVELVRRFIKAFHIMDLSFTFALRKLAKHKIMRFARQSMRS